MIRNEPKQYKYYHLLLIEKYGEGKSSGRDTKGIVMTGLSEDMINDRIAELLRDGGVEIYTHFVGVGEGSNKPDFQITTPKMVFGEGEWETTQLQGFRQMMDYAKLPGAEGSFLIIYPKALNASLVL